MKREVKVELDFLSYHKKFAIEFSFWEKSGLTYLRTKFINVIIMIDFVWSKYLLYILHLMCRNAQIYMLT